MAFDYDKWIARHGARYFADIATLPASTHLYQERDSSLLRHYEKVNAFNAKRGLPIYEMPPPLPETGISENWAKTQKQKKRENLEKFLATKSAPRSGSASTTDHSLEGDTIMATKKNAAKKTVKKNTEKRELRTVEHASLRKGQSFEGSAGGKTFTMTVDNGEKGQIFKVAGLGTFASPTAAAMACFKKVGNKGRVNGWLFWHIDAPKAERKASAPKAAKKAAPKAAKKAAPKAAKKARKAKPTDNGTAETAASAEAPSESASA